MTIGKIILRFRTDKGLTQKEFSQICGFSQSALNLWESGKRKPKMEQIKKIATAFQCDVSDILYETDIYISTNQKDRSNRNITELPNSIVLDITQENYKKYTKYFDAGFLNIKELLSNMTAISAETGKVLKKEEIEDKFDSLSIDDKLTVFRSMVDRFAINPIFDTITIDMYMPDEPPEE